MSSEEKKKIILDFINGPLYDYLHGDISFGRFKELINEKCGTDFTYSELYPSYLFNAQISYPTEKEQTWLHEPEDCVAFQEGSMGCEDCLIMIPNTFIVCGEQYGDQKQYCSKACYLKGTKNE